MRKFFVSDNHIINFEKITAAEARYTYNYSSIESVNVIYHGANTIIEGFEAQRFWTQYQQFAKGKSDD